MRAVVDTNVVAYLLLGTPGVADHVEGAVDYRIDPPVAGPHNPVWANCAFYAVLWILTAIRIVRFPEQVIADISHHGRSVGFFTIVAATCVLGSQFWVIGGSWSAAAALASASPEDLRRAMQDAGGELSRTTVRLFNELKSQAERAASSSTRSSPPWKATWTCAARSASTSTSTSARWSAATAA